MLKQDYNQLLMIKWISKPSIGVLANWGEWSVNEDFLIEMLKNNYAKQNLPLVIINLQDSKKNYQKTICNAVIYNKIKILGIDIINVYDFDNNYFSYKKLAFDMGIQKFYCLKNFDDIDKLVQTSEELPLEILEPKFPVEKISKFRQWLIEGNVKKYNDYFKVNYSFNGIVKGGNQIGRTIGYPTANIYTDNNLILKKAIYVVKVKIPNIPNYYWGIASHWINNNKLAVFETYILNFDDDIYNYNINIEVIDYIRETVKVNNLQELIELLNKDKKYCIENFLKE